MFKKLPTKIVTQNPKPTPPKSSQRDPACFAVGKHERVGEQDYQTDECTNPASNPQTARNYSHQHLVGEPDLAPELDQTKQIIFSEDNYLGGTRHQLSQD